MCDDGWYAPYCATQSPDSSTNRTATFEFEMSAVTVFDGSGELMINVTNSGVGTGEVFVSVVASDISAVAGDDYLGGNGTLVWPAGQVAPQGISVIILLNPNPEGAELFSLQLVSPSTGSHIGAKSTCLVTIQGHIPPGNGAEITIQMIFPASSIPDGSLARAEFDRNFTTFIASASVLNVVPARIVVQSVQASPVGTLLTFRILDPLAGAGPGQSVSAAKLASNFVKMVTDPNSALMTTTAIPPLDPNYPVVPRVAAPSASPRKPRHNNTLAITLGVVIPLLLIVLLVGVCYWKRKSVSQWMLWKAAGMRFNRLHPEVPSAWEDAEDERL